MRAVTSILLLILSRIATAQLSVIDGTSSVVKSTESEFDHEVTLKSGELTFHWNDPQGNTIDCRLIHKTAKDQSPTWLSVGFTSKAETTPSTVEELIVGSESVIGLVSNANVQKYAINGMEISEEDDGTHPLEHQTLLDASIKQHESGDGTASTVLTFTKELEETNSAEIKLNAEGENIWTWGIGPSGETALDIKGGEWGALKLDLAKAKEIASSGGDGADTGSSSTSEATSSTSSGESSSNTSGGLPGGGVSVAADDSAAPVKLGECSSELDGYDKKLSLSPLLAFHWAAGSDKNSLKVALQYQGESWLGFATSKDGKMIGADAIIGKPADSSVGTYALKGKKKDDIIEGEDTLVSSSIKQEEGVTTMEFEAPGIAQDGLNTYLYAVGAGNDFGYHEHRGNFRVDLETCGDVQEAEGGGTKTHMGAFAAHGTIATLAWAIASPFAITVAWFRTLVPSSWIYIHVFSNVLSFFFTLTAVVIAVSAMSMQEGPIIHFSEPHHWVGLTLMVAVTFQVMNGFLRPPVEKKDPYASSQYDLEQSMFKIPRSPREVWYFSHRSTGVALLGMGIYQIHSGLTMFSQNFGVDSVAPWFWGYVGLFGFCLLTLKFWIMFDEYKARRGMRSIGNNKNGNGANGSKNNPPSVASQSHHDSELVPVQFDMS